MSSQAVTLRLPSPVYDFFKNRASQTRRTRGSQEPRFRPVRQSPTYFASKNRATTSSSGALVRSDTATITVHEARKITATGMTPLPPTV